jgi:hypothetical protein
MKNINIYWVIMILLMTYGLILVNNISYAYTDYPKPDPIIEDIYMQDQSLLQSFNYTNYNNYILYSPVNKDLSIYDNNMNNNYNYITKKY